MQYSSLSHKCCTSFCGLSRTHFIPILVVFHFRCSSLRRATFYCRMLAISRPQFELSVCLKQELQGIKRIKWHIVLCVCVFVVSTDVYTSMACVVASHLLMLLIIWQKRKLSKIQRHTTFQYECAT